MTETITGYEFTPEQRMLLKTSFEKVSKRERQHFMIDFGSSATFEAARIRLEGVPNSPSFGLHALPGNPGVMFAALRLGPSPEFNAEDMTTHDTFVDALKQVVATVLDFTRNAAAQPIGAAAAEGFSREDRVWLRELASIVGVRSCQEGYVEFRPFAPGAEVCAVGVKLKGAPIVFATFVGAHGPNGFECSVRNFQNVKLPHLADRFPTVVHAIDAHREYFRMLAATLREQAKPWWKKLF